MFRQAIAFASAILVLGIFSGESSALSIIMILDDEFDNRHILLSLRNDKAVKAFNEKITALADRLNRLKERDIVALFGKPIAQPANTFAMPVAQPRGFGLSGLRYADEKKNKDHVEFYEVGTCAGLKVYYSLDGVSPDVIIFYLRVDDSFPRLAKNNLEKRLDWESRRWQVLLDYVERRQARVKGNVPPAKSTARLSAAQLQQCWDDLASDNSRRAYQAIDQLAAGQNVAFLAGQVKPDDKVDAKEVTRLIQDLRSDQFAVRERASKGLEKWHWLVRPQLEKALAKENILEARRRLSILLGKADIRHRAHLRRYSLAVKVLAQIDTSEAHQLLRQWAADAPEPSLSRQARETVTWLLGPDKR